VSNELERELKEGLGRVPAPEGFADRVMERVARKERLRIRMMPQRVSYVWQMAIAAVVLLAVLFGVAEMAHRREERQRAELVQRQFDVAMRVTGRTLSGVGERISKAGTKDERGEQ
jgi:flagellar biosynthesis/type III secretory pathway M-ring protein FliF/YscJ